MSNIKNGDTPITPIVMDNGHPYHQSQVALENHPQMIGLTKREQFAAMAMQGLLSNSVMGDSNIHENADDWKYEITSSAVEFADSLLEELEK